MNYCVFVHGWGLDCSIWKALQHTLPMPTKALSLPGYQASESMAWEQTAIRHWLREQIPQGSCVVAWSLGGLLAMDLASHHPRHFSRLILIASTPRFLNGSDWRAGIDAAVLLRIRRQVQRSPAALRRRFVTMFPPLGIAGDKQDSLLLQQGSVATQVLLDSLDLLQKMDIRSRLSDVQVPVDIIHGEQDQIVPLSASQYLAETLPDARLFQIAAAGHAVFLSHPHSILDRLTI